MVSVSALKSSCSPTLSR